MRNKEKQKASQKLYYLKNKEKRKEASKQYYIQNQEIQKISQKYNRSINKENRRQYNNIYFRKRKQKDSLFKLKCDLRCSLNHIFQKLFLKKNKKTVEILGCSFEEFKIHLEKQFDSNMNWNNRGSYWELDHIKPISLAKSEQEVIELNHYTNLQPLSKIENRKKSNHF